MNGGGEKKNRDVGKTTSLSHSILRINTRRICGKEKTRDNKAKDVASKINVTVKVSDVLFFFFHTMTGAVTKIKR